METHQSYIQKFSSNFTCTKTNHPTTSWSIIIIIIFLTVYFLYKRHRCNHHLFTFKPNPSKTDTLYCAVCLENVADGERCRKLPKCRHCFHVGCIDTWFEAHPTCPLCRSQVHYISKHQKKKSISSYFLSLSQHIARKIGRLVVDRIAKTFSVGN